MNGYVARKGDWVPGTKLSRTARCQARGFLTGLAAPGLGVPETNPRGSRHITVSTLVRPAPTSIGVQSLITPS